MTGWQGEPSELPWVLDYLLMIRLIHAPAEFLHLKIRADTTHSEGIR